MKLYRGIKNKGIVGKRKNRYLTTPRIPVDTSIKIHHIADNWFMKNLGIKARSETIFVSTCKEQAKIYTEGTGSLLEIEPVGEYEIIYSPLVDDFYNYYIDIGDSPNLIIDWLNSKEYIKINDILKIPPQFLGEVMLSCEEYCVKVIE